MVHGDIVAVSCIQKASKGFSLFIEQVQTGVGTDPDILLFVLENGIYLAVRKCVGIVFFARQGRKRIFFPVVNRNTPAASDP